MTTRKRFFAAVFCSSAALSIVNGDILRGRPQEDFSSYSSSSVSSSSISSSSWSSTSYQRSGVACLHGGTSVLSLTSGEHMFCLCADGFEGKSCENAKRQNCYEGLGLYYRGTGSQTESGRPCEVWDSATRERYLASDINAGRHNYCRNLHYRRRPWCYVLKNQRLLWEYCTVPQCDSATAPPRPTPTDPRPAVGSTCGRRSRRRELKIAGGTVATVESHPWMAAIFWRSRSKESVFRCGGSLISPCWVLTAAHCFPDGSHRKSRRFSVVLGKNALNESDSSREQTFKVEEIVVHEGFDNSEGNFNNDMALVRLKARRGRCAEENLAVGTVCLPPPQHRLQPGVTCEICGYGKEKHGLWYKSQYLREAQVNILADDVCRHEDYYANLITDNMLCAARPDWSQDACQGDSGGPLVCELGHRLWLFGVISWGDGCAKELRPGVYTRVTNYNQWIEEKTGLSSLTAASMFSKNATARAGHELFL